MQGIKNIVWHYKFTIVAVVLIMGAILMPASDIPSVGIPGIDKIVHCGMFGFLTLCLYSEYYYEHKHKPNAVYAMGTIALYAALTEVMQHFIEGRSCDFIDWLADAAGIVLAVVFFQLLIIWINNKKVNQ